MADDAVADFPAGYTLTQFGYLACHIATGNVRHRDFDAGISASDEKVDPVEACCLEIDKDISLAGRWFRKIGDILQRVEIAVLLQDYSFH